MPTRAAAMRSRTVATSAALTATLGLATAAWVISLHEMKGMDAGAATDLGSFSFFVATWVPMMAAMMLPGAVPAVVTCVQTHRRLQAALFFNGSYVAVWTVVGVEVYVLYRPHGTSAAGALTVAAGIYELTPLKRRCRSRSRATDVKLHPRTEGEKTRRRSVQWPL
jgi:predicted metal-binding membrane protein